MPVVAIVNRKGGSGKSTLATHLAAHLAHQGESVLLGDADRQQSMQAWLKLRKAQPQVPRIKGWSVEPRNFVRPPAGTGTVILDTPGGLRGFDLARVVMYADVILIPVANSMFDRHSATACLEELKAMPRVANGRCAVGVVGMRVDSRTRAAEALQEWAQRHALPLVGTLRTTLAYVRCTEQGLSLFDLPAEKTQTDLAQWAPILQWLDPLLQAARQNAEAITRPMKQVHVPDSMRVGSGDDRVTVTKPVVRPIDQADSMANRPRPAAAPVLDRPPPTRSGRRLARLFELLPVPRFLQRNA